ncbi:META domain-containing protein [Candidatus Gracilibacteria bacterium]|nr:META domain-containing protein [Candidatus Gracilibacteria bacterium]MCF7898627.1 META domain-containing protein [Candidatus Paceibacterota bacterium]
MKKNPSAILTTITAAIICIIIAGLYRFNSTNKIDSPALSVSVDVKNSSYIIDGETFTLADGKSEKEITPGSATKHIVSIFGEPVYGDLNNDGIDDAAIMLVSNPGGSGTFYYAVLAIATGSTYTTTNTLLLGDRIAPQTVEIHDGRAVFNYVERLANEPMTTKPSVGKSLWIHYDIKDGNIGEFVKDFEGEADPNRMTLDMKKWVWVKTQMNDGKVITPKMDGKFTLTFNKDGSVNMGTDCNSMGGKYTLNGKTLTFGQMMSTMMYCEGSQEQEFGSALNEVSSYQFTSKGELILEIKMDSGAIIFR